MAIVWSPDYKSKSLKANDKSQRLRLMCWHWKGGGGGGGGAVTFPPSDCRHTKPTITHTQYSWSKSRLSIIYLYVRSIIFVQNMCFGGYSNQSKKNVNFCTFLTWWGGWGSLGCTWVEVLRWSGGIEAVWGGVQRPKRRPPTIHGELAHGRRPPTHESTRSCEQEWLAHVIQTTANS